jgi:hypothetical protein
MTELASIVYWLFGASIAAGFGAIGFSWDRMRRQLNRMLSPEQKLTWYPPLPHALGELFWGTNDLGHFLNVLDRYEKAYPSSSLPKHVAVGVVIWILCFMSLLASGIGR